MTKRTSDQFLARTSEELDDEIENIPMTESCDSIRRKIRSFIESKEMKVGEFQKALNVGAVAYTRFMNQSGADKGFGSQVYAPAWAFFKKRELRGIKTTKKAKTDASGTAKAKDAAKAADALNVDGIELDGEMEDNVPVYDTCDDIRRKINAILKKPGVTAAAFLRAISSQYHTTPKKIQSKQLNDFREKKGPWAGNTSSVFYGSYVFFEKMRIKEKKPKSQKREEMERIWALEHGMNVKERRDNVHMTVLPNERPYVDEYGRFGVERIR